MPRLSVWSIRAALLYLGLGFTFGALLLFVKGIPIAPILWRLLPVHVEFVLIGWTMQLAMGVAFWILPRLSQGRGRGGEVFGWLAFALLNFGVLSVGLGRWSADDGGAILVLAGRAAEMLAALAFAVLVWRRVKPLGT